MLMIIMRIFTLRLLYGTSSGIYANLGLLKVKRTSVKMHPTNSYGSFGWGNIPYCTDSSAVYIQKFGKIFVITQNFPQLERIKVHCRLSTPSICCFREYINENSLSSESHHPYPWENATTVNNM